MYCTCKDKEISFVSANIIATGVVAGSLVDLRNTNRMIDNVAIMVHGNAVAPTTLTAALEQSLDGTNWTSVQAITQANNNTVLYVTGKLTQMLRINVSALTLGSATSVTFSYVAADMADLNELVPEVDAKAVPTKDPAMLLVEEITAKLDELRELLGGSVEPAVEEEVEPQTDEEVMAGIPPTPKKVPGGQPFGM